MEKIYSSMENINAKITEIKLFKYNVEAVRKFSFGVWTSRQHIFIAVKTKEHTGYAENIITINEPNVSLDDFKAWSEALVGLTVTEALLKLRENLGIWRDRYTEMTELALVDLAAREKHMSALELLGLEERHSVPGAYVILNDDPEFVSRKTKEAVDKGISAVIKVKLFGKIDVDLAVIKAVRRFTKRGETQLIGDVNTGYRCKGDERSVDEIANDLKLLYEAGLDACEDPADLTVSEWVELQSKVKPLSLIPDAIMRPSWESIKFIVKGMGDIYNIHPGSAGSLLDAITLAKKVKSLGAELMLGDDSLVGPACTCWQQLAIALGACWVEATEKEEDSDRFFDCVLHSDTDSSVNPIKYESSNNGFGLMLDEEKLASYCMETVIVKER